MIVTLHAWMIPVVITAAVWAALILTPMQRSQGDYDFGPALVAGMRFVGAVGITLLVWLLFFAWLAFA